MAVVLCSNCRKDVPEENFHLHSIHCSRNLKICEQCREPVAICDLEKHTAQVPCPQCKEVMQACDVPSHKTDACALTELQCSYCELQLKRLDMADHELYCGTRTEKCEECSEFVMIKYNKLHLESNHTFLKLDDEPGPSPSWLINSSPKKNKRTMDMTPKITKSSEKRNVHSTSNFQTPEQMSTFSSKGAIKKRIAPQPPFTAGASSSNSDLPHNQLPNRIIEKIPMYKAMGRSQEEERVRNSENVIRTENNLPPILTTAQKVEKLRNMSKLHNIEIDDAFKQRTSKQPQPQSLDPLKNNEPVFNVRHVEYCSKTDSLVSLNRLNSKENEVPKEKNICSKVNNVDHAADLKVFNDTVESLINNRDMPTANNTEVHTKKVPSLSNTILTEPIDRFPGIKNDLQALRKELNKCCSPLENRKNNKSYNEEETVERKTQNFVSEDPVDLYSLSNDRTGPNQDLYQDFHNYDENALVDDVPLPCEFCEKLIPACNLVAHETGCRPHLTSYPDNIKPQNTDSSFNDIVKLSPKAVNLDLNRTKNKRQEHFDDCAAANNTTIISHDDKRKNTFIGKNLNKKEKSVTFENSFQRSHRELKPKKANSRKSLPIDATEADDIPNDFDEVKLPCEFCMSLIPVSRLVWHQEACFKT